MNAALLPAFADPVLQSQQVFRQTLTALAEPACWRKLSSALHLPQPLTPPLGALLLALCDRETPLWLDAVCRTEDVLAWLRFHIACPITSDPAEAAFAVVCDTTNMPDIAAFAQGSTEYPERSTTILLHSEEHGAQFTARGPGIPGTRTLQADLPQTFVAQWQDNGRIFPCGVDLILISATHIAGLPRTTILEAPCM